MRIGKRTDALAALLATAAGLVVAAGPVALQASGRSGGAGDPGVVRMKDARLKFEINATDEDGGIQVFADADSWKRMSIFDPTGRRIFSTTTEGRMAEQGGTELFLESAEPSFAQLPLEQLLERFPEGRYTFRGLGLNGERHIGSARLSHAVPEGPVLLSPLESDQPQDPDRTELRWKQVEPASGSPIIGYQVLVVQPETGLTALPKVTLDVMMPPTASSMVVPRGFLRPGTEYEWEVLAIERGGNQTLSSSTFTTSR